MKNRFSRLLFITLTAVMLSYVVTVFCHLFISRGPTDQAAVYAAYCNNREDFRRCMCPERPQDYGVISSGWPFVSQKDVRYPCKDKGSEYEYAAEEQHSYIIENQTEGFWFNEVFWTLIIGSAIYLLSTKRRHK